MFAWWNNRNLKINLLNPILIMNVFAYSLAFFLIEINPTCVGDCDKLINTKTNIKIILIKWI